MSREFDIYYRTGYGRGCKFLVREVIDGQHTIPNSNYLYTGKIHVVEFSELEKYKLMCEKLAGAMQVEIGMIYAQGYEPVKLSAALNDYAKMKAEG